MTQTLIAQASTVIDRPAADVWRALVTPASIKEYMFGTDAQSEWKEGSPITWKGEWQGKAYEGLPDKPENYHTVIITLTPEGNRTRVSLSQDNNADEQARDHSQKNWEMMLTGLKKFAEK